MEKGRLVLQPLAIEGDPFAAAAKAMNRKVFLFPESAANDARLIRPREFGGMALVHFGDERGALHDGERGVEEGVARGQQAHLGRPRLAQPPGAGEGGRARRQHVVHQQGGALAVLLAELVEGAGRATMAQLTEWTLWADKALVF